MRLGDFSLEILVDNEVLPEHQIPSNNDNLLVPFSRVAVDKIESVKEECKIMTYVAIPEPSCHFAIRVGVHSTKEHVIKGIHFVDGQNDNTYMELNPTSSNGPYNYIYGFYNYNKSIFHLFKFDSTYWSDGNIFISNLPRCIPSKVTRDKGSLGAISVYFYKAERLPEKRISSKKYSNKNQNMELSNSFDDLNFNPSDIIFINNPQEELCLNLKTTHSDPIAVLHIYYQTKEWIENYYKSKASPISKSLDNNSFIKKKKTKVINEDFTIDDLLYGELTDVESEIANSNESNNSSKNLVIGNKDKYNYTHIADNNNFNIDIKVDRNFDKNKNKNINEKDQINNSKNLYNIVNNKERAKYNRKKNLEINNNNPNSKAKIYKNIYSKTKNSMENDIINKSYYNINNSIVETKASSRNLQIESSNNIGTDMEIENNKNLNIETRIKNICLNNIINKTLITENISKKQNIIIIDDDDNNNGEMISNDNELMFISKTEFEKKKIKEIIDLTID
ncbi:18533_t:CDS:2 [Rhizophagus irregularis]|nr:18533_t:CDS:2 [Rhizophagus irregularis]